MDCVNQQVIHKRFGEGKIHSREGGTLRIDFVDYGTRAFAYPEAFEEYLSACDPDFARAVSQDLCAWQAQKAEKDAEKQKARLEMLTEMRAPKSAPVKKAAAKKPAAKKPAAKRAAKKPAEEAPAAKEE